MVKEPDEQHEDGISERTVADDEKVLADLFRERDQLRLIASRAQADLINARRRFNIELKEARERTALRIIKGILDVCDQFEIALSLEISAELNVAWMEGMQGVYRNLMRTLEREGFERFNADGEEFDPLRHYAVLSTPSNEHAPDSIIRQFKAGYIHNGQVVRPAEVEIAVPLENIDKNTEQTEAKTENLPENLNEGNL